MRNISFDRRLIKVEMAGQQAFYGMTADKRLVPFHISHRIEKLKELHIIDLLNFDVIEDLFLLVYSERNRISVYDLSRMRLDAAYKMTLPLYRDFETFEFVTFEDHSMQFKSIVRSSYDSIFTCLLRDPTSGITGIFIYSLMTNQHKSFVMQVDMSE